MCNWVSSAYCCTVLLINDLINTVDEGRVGALALLDLSAAFDTVDHQRLLEILRHRFCVTDSALAWFASYLSDRSQVVHISSTSTDFYLDGLWCTTRLGLGPKDFHHL